jgi:hypothetical protein
VWGGGRGWRGYKQSRPVKGSESLDSFHSIKLEMTRPNVTYLKRHQESFYQRRSISVLYSCTCSGSWSFV